MSYTSEDFLEAKRLWDDGDDADGFYEMISAALAIAARVAEPGVITAAFQDAWDKAKSGVRVNVEAAIRTALQKDEQP